jgi:flagellar M-ring protein FliF
VTDKQLPGAEGARASAGSIGLAGADGSISKSADLEHSIDVANVSGQVKASSMKKIAEMIEQHPDESVSILRNWLNESESRLAS